MKSLKITLSVTTAFLMLFLFIEQANAQLEFIGNYADGMGGAGWNADGSGPEPYGDGHSDIFYYTASRDYVDGAEYCGAKLTDVLNGFPAFEDSLVANGYSYEQVTLKTALSDLGDDIQGIDYFSLGGMHYCNFYPLIITIELDGEALLQGIGDYSMYISGTNVREFQSGFLKISNISGSSSVPVQNVAAAFLADMGNEELQGLMQLSPNVASLNGNGRFGAYTNVVCTFEKGLPEIPFQSQYDNDVHEGLAGWDADGTGPEPYGDGHGTQLYYGASLEYDGIDPDPNACLAHFLEGQTGFLNTMLQLEYRGFEIGDLKIKLGLNSLGPDVEGEDWGNGWSNYYNNSIIIEIDGEPILSVLQDTNKLFSMGAYWSSITSIGKVYDISGNASSEAQFIAQSFLKDLGSHILKTNAEEINYVSSAAIIGNGRDGATYTIDEGSIVGIHHEATFIPEGSASGTWTAEGSPYYVEGHLTIENGQTLEIDPGVRVAVRGLYHITVNGSVNAEGSSEDPIMFTSSNPNLYWDGLDFDGTSITNVPSVFDHCVFQYGQAHGGGEYNSGGIFAVRNYNNIEIYNSTFRHNIADVPSTSYPTCGGAISLWNASPMIQKCIFYDNYALDYGGALLAYMNSSPIISNCLFYSNEAMRGGALAYYANGNGVLINNTIAENSSNMGGGLYFYDQSSPEIINTILWNNSAMLAGNEVFLSADPGLPGFYYCDIEGGQEGFGGNPFYGDYLFNIDEDPMFESDPDFPYIVAEASDCINTGTPDTSAWYHPEYFPETCLCGQSRILQNRIDKGPYERIGIGTGLDLDKKTDSRISLQPNPVNQSASITYELPENSKIKIEIYNYLGQKIETLENRWQYEGKHVLQFNADHLRPGAYFILVALRNEIHTLKFQKIN